jgi:RNase P subunit RPR2
MKIRRVFEANHREDVFVKCESFDGDESCENIEKDSINPPSRRNIMKYERTERCSRGKFDDSQSIDSLDVQDVSPPRNVHRRYTSSQEEHRIDVKCDLCNEPLQSFSQAMKHHQESHNQKGYVICCSRRFRQRSALVDHLEIHANPKRFECRDCRKIFSSQSNLRTHITTAHLPQKRFQCDACGKFANSKSRLAVHLKTHSSLTSKLTCPHKDCSKLFHNQQSLKNHAKTCHNPNRDTFSCEICGKQLMTRSSLKDHVANTHADNIVKIQCHLCGHYIKNEYSMKKHLNRHKQMTEDITCEICGKKCTTKSALRSHLRMKHLLQRTFKCSFCEKSFKQAIDQREHEATHTGVDLYSCLWCTATFKFGANFRAHRKNAHPEEYEKIKPAWLRPN